MNPITFHPEARTEALAAGDYYEACVPGLGLAFVDTLETAFAHIAERPQSFTVHEATGTRKCVLPRFPYLIFFLERHDRLWIIAIAHASRKPEYWHDRLNALQ